jgi:hypothetical protein
MRGRFQIWLAVLCGLLLPFPLMWILNSSLMSISASTSSTQGPALIPMLSPVDREGVLTYGRGCHTDSDCDPRLRCFYSMVVQSSYCVDSRCMTDRDCPDEHACQTYRTSNDKALIKACSVVGPRKEGEVCNVFTRDLEYGCERGLICHARCGRPCQPGVPSTCPAGFFCEGAITGAACQPTCEGRTCPDGQRCVTVEGKSSICATIHGQDCQATPCAPGKACSVAASPWSVHEVWMQCLQPCQVKGAAPCPEGTVCDVHRCRKSCAPDDPTACAEGFTCRNLPGLPAICAPDIPNDAP